MVIFEIFIHQMKSLFMLNILFCLFIFLWFIIEIFLNFFSNFGGYYIVRTNEGQPSPKYIFNKYTFVLVRKFILKMKSLQLRTALISQLSDSFIDNSVSLYLITNIFLSRISFVQSALGNIIYLIKTNVEREKHLGMRRIPLIVI